MRVNVGKLLLTGLRRHAGVTRLVASTLGLWALTCLISATPDASAQTAPVGRPAPEAAALPSGGPVRGATYVVDPTHTFVTYEIGHYGATTNRGRFSTSDGTVKVDATGGAATIDITMDISTVNTGVDVLNRHLQSKDFFNAADYPTGHFRADRVRLVDGNLVEAPGVLTLLGKSVPVTLKAKRFKCYVSPLFNRQVCGGDFDTVVKRSEFDIVWGLTVGFEDDVHLDVQVEAVEAP